MCSKGGLEEMMLKRLVGTLWLSVKTVVGVQYKVVSKRISVLDTCMGSWKYKELGED